MKWASLLQYIPFVAKLVRQWSADAKRAPAPIALVEKDDLYASKVPTARPPKR